VLDKLLLHLLPLPVRQKVLVGGAGAAPRAAAARPLRLHSAAAPAAGPRPLALPAVVQQAAHEALDVLQPAVLEGREVLLGVRQGRGAACKQAVREYATSAVACARWRRCEDLQWCSAAVGQM
jgi:hypothetical protein